MRFLRSTCRKRPDRETVFQDARPAGPPSTTCQSGGPSRWNGLKRHTERVGLWNREIQLLETENSARSGLHQDDLVAGFLANIFARARREPDGQGFALSIVEHLHFGHTWVPSLMASVGYAV